ncbi:hypothetical protein DI272_17495 [Streptomyces sp. Act143]|nr:hypothetical protein DI272_17495 [Streptomyces sp. Act143]
MPSTFTWVWGGVPPLRGVSRLLLSFRESLPPMRLHRPRLSASAAVIVSALGVAACLHQLQSNRQPCR